MSDPRLISPMLDNFAMGDPISEHDGVACCPAMESGKDDKYIVKIISIPANESQAEALLLSGAYNSRDAVVSYFAELSEGVVHEIETLNRLAELEGYLPVEKYQLVPMEDGSGFEIYMLTRYGRTLEKHMSRSQMTHLATVNLGLDLCAALSVARQNGYLYVNLKPANVYMTENGDYKIGDIGFLPLDSLKYAFLPERYRTYYSAPEVTDAYSALNDRMDVYSVGLILYQIYNNGELPFTDEIVPGDILPPPVNADYEMSEIILKACAPDPAERWADPVEMGQALVGYMQRNTVNDDPILPPAAEITEEAEEAREVDEEAEEEIELTEEELSEMEDVEVSEDVSEILDAAEDLAAHPVPDPVVAPEAVEVTLPEPEEENTDQEEPTEEASEESAEDAPEDTSEEATEETPEENGVAESQESEENNEETAREKIEIMDSPVEEFPVDIENHSEEEPKPEKKKSNTLRNTLIGLLIIILLGGCVFYYRTIYLQPVNGLTLDGEKDTLTVSVDSPVNEDDLTVVCSDTYGNKITAPVIDGKADFKELNANTAYTVTVEVSGFHRLTGKTSAVYSTPALSEIVQFSAVTGAEAGSAIIGFTVDGPDSEQWTLTMTGPSGEEQTATFAGHLTTVTGLAVGSTYTFTIQPVEDLFLSGEQTLSFTASELVYPQELKAESLVDGVLTVSWKAPANTSVSGWIVRCTDGEDYNETINTDSNTAAFTEINSGKEYTVEVNAAGMSVNQSVTIPANSLNVTNFKADFSGSIMNMSWEAPADAGELNVLYSVNGYTCSSPLPANGNTCSLNPVLPGMRYYISIRQADGKQLIGSPFAVDTPQSGVFTCTFGGFTITANQMVFRMCNTPGKQNWTYRDVDDSAYTSAFSAGSNASFVVKANKKYGTSFDEMVTTVLIKDGNGQVISLDNESRAWSSMWNKSYCYINVPSLPAAAGAYNISIYFNGALAHQQDFTIN